MVKNLDGFLTNLTSVTSALQIAFDSTLLALFLSAALMLVQTLVFRRSEDLLARVDRWVVDHVLPRVGADNPVPERLVEIIGPQLDRLGDRLAQVMEPAVRSLESQSEKLGESLQTPIAQFAREIERLPEALISFKQAPTRSDAWVPISRRSARRASRCAEEWPRCAHRNDRRAVAQHRSPARGDQAGARARRGVDRHALRFVVGGVRAVQPGHSGAARAQPDQPEGCPRALERQHGAGQRPLSNDRQETVR